MNKEILEYLNSSLTAKVRLAKASAALAAECPQAADGATYLSSLIETWEKDGGSYPPKYSTKTLRQSCRRNLARLLRASYKEELKGYSVVAKITGLEIQPQKEKKELTLQEALTDLLTGKVAEATLAEILALVEAKATTATVKKAA